MKNDTSPERRLKSRYTILYVLSVIALGLLLCANFAIIYTLVVAPSTAPGVVMRFVYLIMVAGFFVLVAQSLLVFKRFISLLGSEARAVDSLKGELEQLAVLDDLTRVYNRYKFELVASRELENVRRYSIPLSGVMFDVDDFKGINDAHGYGAGDRLLTNLAQFVKGKLRNSDYVFRWRGGKFIILCPHTDIDKAAIVAEKLRQIVGHKLFGGKIRMTLSFGVIQSRQDDSIETFLHRIQSALTGAKNQGRNCVVVSRD